MKHDLKLSILEYNYWEHFKALKDISLVLPIEHPRRRELDLATNDLSEKINTLKNQNHAS